MLKEKDIGKIEDVVTEFFLMKQDLFDSDRQYLMQGLSTEEVLSEGLTDIDDLIPSYSSYSSKLDPKEEEEYGELEFWCNCNDYVVPSREELKRNKEEQERKRKRELEDKKMKEILSDEDYFFYITGNEDDR